MISANLRFLKHREGEGYYMKNGLCESCGHHLHCGIESAETRLCTGYQPVIPFKSLAGTEGLFNTFRLGGAWANRVKKGDTIGLLNTQGEKVATAVVRSVHVATKEEMLAEHAHLNHLMLAKGSRDPVADLTKTVRNLYGTNFFAKAALMTVIYLRRTGDNPG